jgi:flagellar hook-associated protein 3 FlgL
VLSNLSSSAADINTAVADLNTKFSLSQVTVNAAQVILGSNQNRLTTMDTIGDENNITNQGVVSSLEDVDYNKVLSDLSRQQLQLQVAQKTFQQISSLSIFNYIN